ncbi:DUF2169 domain-containing protein [Pseudozobellia sp. WGM2]|uniref:DUF2169 domain-containing protein n=1 Tax=Pseudozobellia sp. WGM2 TaxID=2787625 RepID=UPI001AE0E2F9|nr:DUF2169 domain-containing protein [Pseudozobellia sp. WGM2]
MKKTAQLLSGKNSKGKPFLSLIVKRTYEINDNGSCSISDKQLPLVVDLKTNKENDEIVDQDIDLYPFKPFTDIIVKGKARSVKNTFSFLASVEIAKLKLDLQIQGNRKVYKKENGSYAFSEAESINEIPLEYKYSYGGKDLLAEKPFKEKIMGKESFKHILDVVDPFEGSPYRYPRNPIGKGFIVEPNNETIETLNLPNIEDPNNLLTSENFICKEPFKWYRMPVPVCTDWVCPGWFPRIAYFGIYPLPNGLDENIYEIKNKWSSKELLKSTNEIKKSQFSFRACNGASLGLQSRYLFGGESCRLTNIHPDRSEFVFRLPQETPKIKVDGRNGKLLRTSPVMHSVIIEPDKKKLSIVWCGSAKAIRPYFEEELKTMPYEVIWP